MTVICAVYDPANDRVLIGSDLQSTSGNGNKMPTAELKWLVSPDKKAAIGVAGFMYYRRVFERYGKALFVGSADEIAMRMRGALCTDGTKPIEEPGPIGYNSSFIIVSRGIVYDCDGCFGITRMKPGQFWARGSGADLALGAYYAAEVEWHNLDRKKALRVSIMAAVQYDTGCSGLWIDDVAGSTAYVSD